jgi:hypothetical protein
VAEAIEGEDWAIESQPRGSRGLLPPESDYLVTTRRHDSWLHLALLLGLQAIPRLLQQRSLADAKSTATTGAWPSPRARERLALAHHTAGLAAKGCRPLGSPRSPSVVPVAVPKKVLICRGNAAKSGVRALWGQQWTRLPTASQRENRVSAPHRLPGSHLRVPRDVGHCRGGDSRPHGFTSPCERRSVARSSGVGLAVSGWRRSSAASVRRDAVRLCRRRPVRE